MGNDIYLHFTVTSDMFGDGSLGVSKRGVYCVENITLRGVKAHISITGNPVTPKQTWTDQL